MKVWAVATNTFRGLLRSRALIAFLVLFLLTFLTSVSTVYFATRLADVGAGEQAELLFARQIEQLLSTFAVYAFLLAVLAGAYLLPGEITAGTILPTLGRALPRSQYLLGLFLAMNLLLATYLGLAAVFLGGLFAWSGVPPEVHLLWGLLYVVLVANILAGLAFFFSTLVGALPAVAATGFYLLLPATPEAVRVFSQEWAERVEKVVDYLVPAWGLLDYESFFVLTRSPAAREASVHLTGIAHALDYLAVFLLLAILVFRRRSLLPPS